MSDTKKSKTKIIPQSVTTVLERHGITAIVDGQGNLVLSAYSQNYKHSTLESRSTFPNQSVEFHLANSMASTLYQLGAQFEKVMQELDMAAASYFDESVALSPFFFEES